MDPVTHGIVAIVAGVVVGIITARRRPAPRGGSRRHTVSLSLSLTLDAPVSGEPDDESSIDSAGSAHVGQTDPATPNRRT
jgi:hypothetical protein